MAIPNKLPREEEAISVSAITPFVVVSAEIDGNLTFENDASNFRAKCVAFVAQDETKITQSIQAFKDLGFEAACTTSLEAAFEVVSEDPEEWAMIAIVLDRQYSKTELAGWVHQLRMVDFRIPIMLLSDQGPKPHWEQEPTRLGDCCLACPSTPSELDAALGIALRANRKLGSDFRHFKNGSVPRPLNFRHHSRV
ncbi:response regulator transcription factor [Aliiroseovarius marinus]|uniref:response regulator transcription factor n=1 Tax=Aliiroseovarius marinus TaxID=2500159 RepID=UPI00105E28F7|nr:response regulator transcription factor [Aliiroseovarius marinus]